MYKINNIKFLIMTKTINKITTNILKIKFTQIKNIIELIEKLYAYYKIIYKLISILFINKNCN